MNSEEERAITDCQSGDHERFTPLYDAYFPRIYAYLYRLTGEKETAEDLTSATFILALRRINTFSPSKGSFSSWLYAIARNESASYFRSHRPTAELDRVEAIASRTNVAADADLTSQLSAVREYLSTLKQADREVIYLRIWEERTFEEISEITGKSMAASKMAFFRAIRRLRQDLAYLIISLLLILIHYPSLTHHG